MEIKRFGRIFQDAAIRDGEPVINKAHKIKVAPKTFETLYTTVKEVMTLLEDAGMREREVRGIFPHLNQKDISACRAFAAVNMPDSKEYSRNNRNPDIKILLDENIPHSLVIPLSHHMSSLSHIYYEGMTSYMDDFIYWRPYMHIKDHSAETPEERTRRRGIKHIIISNDSDLCDLAYAQWQQRVMTCATPEDIDFTDTNTVYSINKWDIEKIEKDEKFCQKMAASILNTAHNPKGPWYKIRSNGSVYPGVTLQEMCKAAERNIEIEQYKAAKETGFNAPELS